MNEKEIQKYIKELLAYQFNGVSPNGSKLSEVDNIRISEEVRSFQAALRLIQSTKVKTRGSSECKMPFRKTPSKAWYTEKLPRTTRDINEELV